MPYDSPHFRLESLAQGVFVARARPEGLAWSNAGIIDLGGYTLVFDTFFSPAAGEDLRRAAEIVTGRMVNWVVNSSYRLAHTGGNQAFPNAAVLATATARQMMADRVCAPVSSWRKNPGLLLDALHADDGVDLPAGMERALSEILPGLHPTLPEQTFTGRMELHGSLRSAALQALEDDPAGRCVLRLEEDGLLFAGDAAVGDERRYVVIPGR